MDGNMNFNKLTSTIERHGFLNFCKLLSLRMFAKVVDLNVLNFMTLDLEDVDPKFLEENPKFVFRVLQREEALRFAALEETNLSLKVVEEAFTKGDRIYGLLDGDRLASYGFYSEGITGITDDLSLVFGPGYVYMSTGYTLPDYRGERLHGIGMARSLAAYKEEDRKALISFVDASNLDSLKSVYRLGYKDIGKAIYFKLFGKYHVFHTGRCRDYGVRVVPTAPDASGLPPIGMKDSGTT